MESLETRDPIDIAPMDTVAMASAETAAAGRATAAGASHEASPPQPDDQSIFVGAWTSTNRDTQGIARVVIRRDGDWLFVRPFGACTPVCDWGETRADVFVDGPGSTRAYAFTARFDLGFKETAFQAKVEKGVLVVANFNRFKDGSGRANFFGREFFYREPAELASPSPGAGPGERPSREGRS
jgi:hypothetical protein